MQHIHPNLLSHRTLSLMLVLLTSLFLFRPAAQAQDPGFSQFFASPMTLNPALTGKFDGAFRVAGNYRNQWPAINNAFITSTASIDFPILTNKLPVNDTWLRSPTEAINSEYVSVHYFDAGLGALYNASTNGNNNYYFGLSAYHLNHPKVSFLGEDTINIPVRVTLHGGGFFPIAGTSSTIYVSGLVNNQAGSREYVLGGAWQIAASTDETNPVNFYAGLWGRFTNNTTDAIIPYVGLDYSNFSLGITYDVNVSALSTASESRGGIEISLIYIKKKSNGQHGVPCPRF